jgi:hypothetical protein
MQVTCLERVAVGGESGSKKGKDQMVLRILRYAIAVIASLAMLPAGLAAAHGYDCWTAGPGYSLTCGPKSHTDYAAVSPYPALYSFDTFIRYSQWSLGNFDWDGIRIMNGTSYTGDGEFADTTVYQENGGGGATTVYYTTWWLCKGVGTIQYDDLSITAHNGTTSGTWYQWVYASMCADPTRGTHTMNVYAY